MAASEGERWGSYVLEEKIAAGGMGEVFRARRVGAASFSKQVCIKRLHAHLSSDPEFVAMFLDEARTGSALRHRNIVAIDDLGEHAGQYFLAMEYVNGVDLAQLEERARKTGTAIPADVGAFVAAEVLGALHAAYNAVDPDDGRPLHVVHRDVSPHNVLVSFSAEIKLTDFGIARAERRARATTGQVVRGRFGYMPVEQIAGAPLDARADLFALGVVLYELLAGRRPFCGDNPDATLEAILGAQLTDQRPALASQRPDLPRNLVTVVETLMAARADDRYPSAAAALAALSEVREVLTGSMSLAGLMARLFPGLSSAMYVPTPSGLTPPSAGGSAVAGARSEAAPAAALSTAGASPRSSLVEGTPPGALAPGSFAGGVAASPGGASGVDPYAPTRGKLELVAQTDPDAIRAPHGDTPVTRGDAARRGGKRGLWLAGGAAVVLLAGAAFARQYLRGDGRDAHAVAQVDPARSTRATTNEAAPTPTPAPPSPPAPAPPEQHVDPPPAPAPPAPVQQVDPQHAPRDPHHDHDPHPHARGSEHDAAAPAVTSAPTPPAPAPSPEPAPQAPAARYGMLRIVATPYANVSIDGIPRGLATFSEYRLTEGHHVVVLHGGVEGTRTVTIHEGQTAVVQMAREDPNDVTP